MKPLYPSMPLVRIGQFVILSSLLALLLVTVGCGGSGSSSSAPPTTPSPTPTPTPSGATATQVKIGDAPADRVLSFEVTVGPITLTPSSGSPVTVLSGTQRVELTHLSGTNEPLVLLKVPQGTYSSASLTVANPEVTFLNSLGVLSKLEPTLSQNVTVTLNPALSIAPSPSVVNLDLNVAKSLKFDSQGNITGVSLSAASFAISNSAVASDDKQNHENGELEDITGRVTAVSGTSFTMTVGQNGTSLSFTTDSATEFNDGATLATMLNTIVTVEGITRSDGTLYAKEVEGVENEGGAELEGLVTQVVGNPGTQLSFVGHDGSGNGVDDNQLGSSIAVDITGAQYKVDKSNIDTSGIGGIPSSPDFPFDASTIHAGQRVEVDSDGVMAGTNVRAEKVKLQQQALTGTVSGLPGSTTGGPVTFTLTLPSDAAFAMLSGHTSITVFWQPGTDLHNLSSVSNGEQVRVRGLIFFNGNSFNMIARRIDQ